MGLMTVGSQVAQYRIEARLGGGALGDVYRAHDNRLDRPVALRILSEELTSDRDRVFRFLQEVRAAMSLKHPNIAGILEIGESEGLQFVAMEHVEGRPLQPGALSVPEVLDVARQICAALGAAHARRMAHQGLRPSNLLRTEAGQIKLLDFGLVKAGRGRKQTGVTDAEGLAYLSPEQVQDRRREIGRRSDIYSLGVVLYELLTGRLPFTAVEPEALIDEIANVAPAPLTDLKPDLPPDLDRIVRKCLEKDRHHRYHSVQEFLYDLKRSDTTPTAPGRRPQRARRKLSRWKLAAAFALVLAAGAVAVYVNFTRGVDSLAILPFTSRSGKDAEPMCDGLTSSLAYNFSQLGPERAAPAEVVWRYKGKNVDAVTAARELNVSAVLTGRVAMVEDMLDVEVELIQGGDGSQLWQHHYSRRPQDLLGVQDDITREIAGRLRRVSRADLQRITKQHTLNPDAYALYLEGSSSAAQGTPEGFSRAAELFEKAALQDPRYALAQARLAESCVALADLDAAPPAQLARKAKNAATSAVDIDSGLAEAHRALAEVQYRFEWRMATAEESFRQAIALQPGDGAAHAKYAQLLSSRGSADQEVEETRQAYQLQPRSFPVVLDTGLVLWMAHHFDEAIVRFRVAAELPGANPLARVLAAASYSSKNEHERALKELPAATGEGPLEQSLRGYVLARAGRTAEAHQVLAALEQMASQRYVSPSRMAEVYAGLGDRARVLEYLDRAFDAGCVYLPYLSRWPPYDSLHEDPRFQDMLRRAGFAPTRRL